MTQPQPPQPVTRRYPTDAHYNADALSLATTGWRVVSVQREPDGAIVATYAPVDAQPQPQPVATQPDPTRISAPQQSRALLFLGAIISGVILLAILGGIVNAAVSGSQPSSQANVHPATPGAYATTYAATFQAMASQSTATTRATYVSGPRLGAPLGDFDAALSNAQTDTSWSVTFDGQPVMITVQQVSVTHGQITTPDGQDRVWAIGLIYLNSTPPSAAQNAIICRQFMPSDAQHIADNANASTIEHIYRSQQLAASFNANAFQNNAGADVTPGTFDVVYGAKTCDITTGQN